MLMPNPEGGWWLRNHQGMGENKGPVTARSPFHGSVLMVQGKEVLVGAVRNLQQKGPAWQDHSIGKDTGHVLHCYPAACVPVISQTPGAECGGREKGWDAIWQMCREPVRGCCEVCLCRGVRKEQHSETGWLRYASLKISFGLKPRLWLCKC